MNPLFYDKDKTDELLSANEATSREEIGQLSVAVDTKLDGKADIEDIPTVNNPTITFTQGGTTKGSFTLNQPGGTTIALDAGGGGGGGGVTKIVAGSNITISPTSGTGEVRINASAPSSTKQAAASTSWTDFDTGTYLSLGPWSTRYWQNGVGYFAIKLANPDGYQVATLTITYYDYSFNTMTMDMPITDSLYFAIPCLVNTGVEFSCNTEIQGRMLGFTEFEDT